MYSDENEFDIFSAIEYFDEYEFDNPSTEYCDIICLDTVDNVIYFDENEFDILPTNEYTDVN